MLSVELMIPAPKIRGQAEEPQFSFNPVITVVAPIKPLSLSRKPSRATVSTLFSLSSPTLGDMDADYIFCGETNWASDDISGAYYDSSSPDNGVGTSSCLANEKSNIVMERNRRRKLNERLYTLRSVVPNITKMEKASIIMDAIVYIEELKEQERRMMAEISESESRKASSPLIADIEQCESVITKVGKKRIPLMVPNSPSTPSIDVMELRVRGLGNKSMVISLTLKKKRDTMMNICEVFKSLNLKIITANITTLSGTILHTLLVESDDINCDQLKDKIVIAIASLDAKKPPASFI